VAGAGAEAAVSGLEAFGLAAVVLGVVVFLAGFVGDTVGVGAGLLDAAALSRWAAVSLAMEEAVSAPARVVSAFRLIPVSAAGMAAVSLAAAEFAFRSPPHPASTATDMNNPAATGTLHLLIVVSPFRRIVKARYQDCVSPGNAR
jgi:hypothetical protein